MVDAVQFKCKNCGANLKFSADDQKFNCEYCLSSFTKEELENDPELEQELTEEQKEEYKACDETMSLYSCPNCGAEILADDNTSATFCYYCHAPVILKGRLQGSFRPTRVIPFQYTREKMLEKYKQWCSKKWFIPKDYMSSSQTEKIAGIYLPYWLTDCQVDAHVTADCKDSSSRVSGEYRYTTTKEYRAVRDGTFEFNMIPADASSKADDELMQALEPYDYSAMKPFSMTYLSGYLSEKYDIDKEKVFPITSKRVTDCTRQTIKNSIHHQVVTITSQNYKIKNVNVDYVLMPVWFMTYKYGEKYYYFAMNGQTGKISGLPPLDKLKLFMTGLGITLGGALIGLIISLLGII